LKTTAASSEIVGTPPAIEILPGQVAGRLDFPGLFGNRRPVEVEVGIGKGRFLLRESEARPDVNFLGLEWSLKHLRVAKERAERRGLVNVRLYRADARHVMRELLADASVSSLHVYCPDPWPKKRHRKRRFFTPEMVPHLERVLAPGGRLSLSTDVREYFEEIREMLRSRSSLVEAEDPDPPGPGDDGRTNYEVKYLMAGRTIHRASYARTVAPA
jgi:tRNA (guanine-N7-)-methyltransferase